MTYRRDELPVRVPTHWMAEQALALHDVLAEITEVIWHSMKT